MPAGLIPQKDGVCAGRDGPRDLRQVKGHGGGVAGRQDEPGAGPAGRADGAEDVSRARALVVRRRGACAASRPAPGDLVLLPDPRLILEPDLYRLAGRIARGDLLQAGGAVFLNVASASASWA